VDHKYLQVCACHISLSKLLLSCHHLSWPQYHSTCFSVLLQKSSGIPLWFGLTVP
jgi:hypothetical protein